MSRIGIFVSLPTEEIKDLVERFAKSKGYLRASDVMRVAIVDYMKRRKPKDPRTALHQQITAISNGMAGGEDV